MGCFMWAVFMWDCVVLQDLLDRGTPLQHLPATWTKHTSLQSGQLPHSLQGSRFCSAPTSRLRRRRFVLQACMLQHVTLPEECARLRWTPSSYDAAKMHSAVLASSQHPHTLVARLSAHVDAAAHSHESVHSLEMVLAW